MADKNVGAHWTNLGVGGNGGRGSAGPPLPRPGTFCGRRRQRTGSTLLNCAPCLPTIFSFPFPRSRCGLRLELSCRRNTQVAESCARPLISLALCSAELCEIGFALGRILGCRSSGFAPHPA